MNNTFKNISAKVERVIYFNNRTNWGVLSVTNTINDKRFPELTVTLVGNFDGLYQGCHIKYSGEFTINATYGNQIKITQITTVEDGQTAESTINFLAKSKIRGISVQNAKKIWKTFGKKSIEVVLNNPERLAEIKGIGDVTIEEIAKSVTEYKYMEELIEYCCSLGIPYSVIYRLYQEFNTHAKSIIEKDIYSILTLSEVFSFQQVDAIGLKLGVDRLDPRRLKACLVNQLINLVQFNSSIGCSNNDLRTTFQKESGVADLSYYTATLNTLKNEQLVTIEGTNVYYYPYLQREEYIAWMISNIMGIPPVEKPVQEQIDSAIRAFPFTLNKQQINAINNVFNSRVSIITGGPGSGKSTITKAIVDVLEATNRPFELLSPTGKATRRMEECTGVSASTIHKYLGLGYTNEHFNSNVPTVATNITFIVDECSMIDVNMTYKLLELAEQAPINVIFIGDKDQLPSVQAGNILGDMINSGVIPVFTLTDIVRQANDSHIIKYCDAVNKGKAFKECDFDDFVYKVYEDDNELINDLLDNYQREVNEHGLQGVQVISPYKEGALGTKMLNEELASYVNENDANKEWDLAVGDKVMQLINDYGKNVFNGEVGIVESVTDDCAIINFNDSSLEYRPSEASYVTRAYATTCHKSQGAEFPVVFIVLENSRNGFLLTRKLIYTAMSRGKQKVYVYSMENALNKCVDNTYEVTRITKLWKLLQEKLNATCVEESKENEYLPF